MTVIGASGNLTQAADIAYPGELEAVETAYRNTCDGQKDARGTFYLYGYDFPLDESKSIESITLPDNRNVTVLAITLAR